MGSLKRVLGHRPGPDKGDAGNRLVAQGRSEKAVRTRRRSETARGLSGFMEARAVN